MTYSQIIMFWPIKFCVNCNSPNLIPSILPVDIINIKLILKKLNYVYGLRTVSIENEAPK